MGTRADFYVGRGEQAEWLGSIAWDGYPEGITLTTDRKDVLFKTPLQTIETNVHEPFPQGGHLFDATTEEVYRSRVEQFFAHRDDVTRPERGWPWPWETSHLTDYAYAFDAGVVYACCFGHRWYRADDPALNDDETDEKETVFPDMTQLKNVTMGRRSGLIVLSAPR
jgi:hypothetical protein